MGGKHGRCGGKSLSVLLSSMGHDSHIRLLRQFPFSLCTSKVTLRQAWNKSWLYSIVPIISWLFLLSKAPGFTYYFLNLLFRTSGSPICPCLLSQSLRTLLGLSTQPIPHHSSSAWPGWVQGMPGTALALLHRAWNQAPLLRAGPWGTASVARGGAVLKKPSAVAWNGREHRRWSGSSQSPYRLPGAGGKVNYLLWPVQWV